MNQKHNLTQNLFLMCWTISWLVCVITEFFQNRFSVASSPIGGYNLISFFIGRLPMSDSHLQKPFPRRDVMWAFCEDAMLEWQQGESMRKFAQEAGNSAVGRQNALQKELQSDGV